MAPKNLEVLPKTLEAICRQSLRPSDYPFKENDGRLVEIRFKKTLTFVTSILCLNSKNEDDRVLD